MLGQTASPQYEKPARPNAAGTSAATPYTRQNRASSIQCTVKGNQRPAAFLGERQKPRIGQNLRRRIAPGGQAAKTLAHLDRFRAKYHALVFKEAFVHAPRIVQSEWFSIHCCGCSGEPEQTHLRESAKRNPAGLGSPPSAGRGAVDMFGTCQSQPDVNVRQAQ